MERLIHVKENQKQPSAKRIKPTISATESQARILTRIQERKKIEELVGDEAFQERERRKRLQDLAYFFDEVLLFMKSRKIRASPIGSLGKSLADHSLNKRFHLNAAKESLVLLAKLVPEFCSIVVKNEGDKFDDHLFVLANQPKDFKMATIRLALVEKSKQMLLDQDQQQGKGKDDEPSTTN